MQIYKIKLNIDSGIITHFQSDTIFGHLCWVIAHQQGEEGLQNFLEPFKQGSPPFVISDAFPADYLPKPLSAEFTTEEDSRKDIKKVDYVSEEDFKRICRGEPVKLKRGDVIKNTTSAHNTINRLTNTTGEVGSVYSLLETIIPEVSIYLKVSSNEWKGKVVDLLTELSKTGYGKKKSIGKGQFSVSEVTPHSFNDIKDANGFVTLSNFCPAENDPIEGLYKTFVKYGKLGEEFTFCGNPFKRPLLMLKAGSVFKTDSLPQEFYGRMIREGVSPAKPEVVQYAYAFAVPIKYPALKG